MGSVTISNGITIVIPSKGTLNWNDQMAAAMKAISGHDHTGSGKGNPITTNALAAKCVTAAKIADETITGDQIQDNSIASSKIIGGTGGDAAAVVTGSILMTMNTTAPSTYALLKGQVVSQTGSYATLFGTAGWGDSWAAAWGQGNEGAGNWRLPDFTRRMPIGYDGVIGAVGSVGGTWNHNHTTAGHYHGMGAGADLAVTVTGGGTHTTDISHTHPSANTGGGSGHTHSVTVPAVDTSIPAAGTATAGNGLNTGHSPTFVAAGRNDQPSGITQISVAFESIPILNLTSGGDSGHVHSFPGYTYSANSGSDGSHSHGASIAGRIGNVTGNTDGNSAITSSNANGPYVITNFMVKL